MKTNNVCINNTLRCVSITIVAVQKKEVLHIRSVSAALVIQYAKRMHRIIFSSVASLAVPYISRIISLTNDFREMIVEHKMCVLVSSTTFVRNISQTEKNTARYYHKCT
jgi:hypothetical protein